MVNNKANKSRQRNASGAVEQKPATAAATTSALTTPPQSAGPKQKQTTTTNNNSNKTGNNNNKKVNTSNNNNNNTQNNAATTTQQKTKNNNNNNGNNSNGYNGNNGKQSNQSNNTKSQQQQRKALANTNSSDNNLIKNQIKGRSGTQPQSAKIVAIAGAGTSDTTTTATTTNHNSMSTYAETVGLNNNTAKTRITRIYTNSSTNNNNKKSAYHTIQTQKSDIATTTNATDEYENDDSFDVDSVIDLDVTDSSVTTAATTANMSASDLLTAALTVPCAKCSKSTTLYAPVGGRQYRKSKSYVAGGEYSSVISVASLDNGHHGNGRSKHNNNNGRHHYHRSYSDRRSSFDRNFAERNKDFVPIAPPPRPVLSSSNIAAVIADVDKLVIIERLGKGRISYPIMQCGTLDAPDSSYHQQRSNRMDVYQIDDGFHSDGGTETPPPSPSSGSSIASASDHGSLESVDTGGTQRLAVLSFEQVRKLHDVMDEKVAIHGRGNFPTLEVTLKDLVNLVRRKLEADVNAGGAGVIVKDVRLNGGAASHVLASEDQPYNDLDLIYAIELSSSRHFDRVKTAVLNTLLDLLPEGVSKRRIMPCALKEAYVGKMVKVNNNNDGDRWSLISLGNSPGHKNVELKFVDTMRRQFEFSVDSFQIVLDSLLLFYDCAALPISENFYPTVVGESVYGDFQEALYHLQKKLISTRQPEEIRGGGLLKYCNLLVRNYKPVDPQRIKTLERYMCSRFFIDFPDINTQTVKLEAYLRNHFWGVDEEPLQYKYLMHLREVVEMSTVCLMGHERRQTLLLIQSLAAQVLYKEQHKQHQAQEHYHQQQHQQHQHQQHQQQQQQQQQVDLQKQQQQQQTVTLVSTQQQQLVQQPQTIYVQQAPPPPQTTTICCAALTTTSEQQSAAQQQQQQVQVQSQQQAAAASVPQTIQLQAGPPGLIYNGVFYAPVLPAAICTCNSTWLST